MSRTQTKRSVQSQNRRKNRILMIVFAAVLFVGLFSQVAMVARLSGQAKTSQAVEQEIRLLNANAENLNMCLSRFQNLDRVEELARQMGMKQPSEKQIRVVSLPAALESTSTQSAENISAEEMQ